MSEEQIRRDHLLSHVLASLPDLLDGVTFIGGTALCRTHLADWRLSEDVDLLVEHPSRCSEILDKGLGPALRREHPGLSLVWERDRHLHVGEVRSANSVMRVQLVPFDDSYGRYPVAVQQVQLRYEDLPSTVELACPDPIGAGAMKLNAWVDRAAPRDLVDLYGLVVRDLLDRDSLDVAAAAAQPVQLHSFSVERLPTAESWSAALDRQMPTPPGPEEALGAVRERVARLLER